MNVSHNTDLILPVWSETAVKSFPVTEVFVALGLLFWQYRLQGHD